MGFSSTCFSEATGPDGVPETCLPDLIHSTWGNLIEFFSLFSKLSNASAEDFRSVKSPAFQRMTRFIRLARLAPVGLNCRATPRGITRLNTWQGPTRDIMKDERVSPALLLEPRLITKGFCCESVCPGRIELTIYSQTPLCGCLHCAMKSKLTSTFTGSALSRTPKALLITVVYFLVRLESTYLHQLSVRNIFACGPISFLRRTSSYITLFI